MQPVMNATDPLTLKNLYIESYDFDKTKDQIFRSEKVFRYLGIGVIALTIIVTLAFVVRNYYTWPLTQSEIISVSTSGGALFIFGLAIVGASLYKRFNGLNLEKPNGLNHYQRELETLLEVFDRDKESSNQFIITRPALTREFILASYDQEELKSFIVQVCLDHYDLRTGACDRPDLINDLKLQADIADRLGELEKNLPPGFVALFN